MNILVFSPAPSHPQTSGSRKRIYNLCERLQEQGHHIHFVYYNEDIIKECDCEAMRRAWETLTVIPRTQPCRYRHGNYGFDEWYQEDISAYVNRVIALFDIDAVWMNYVWHSKLLEAVPGHVLKVIDTHDKFADRFRLLEANGDRAYVWFSCSEADEKAYLNRADAVVAIQEEEASYFRSLTDAGVLTLKHIERSRFLDKNYSALKTIGFIGSNIAINRKALNGFLEAFYRSSRYRDAIEVVVAGSVCGAVTAAYPGVTLLGEVEDLEGFYESVDLIVNPLTFGTGLKIKSVEALAYGVPVVSTRIGFEGIESRSEYHRADNAAETVCLIGRLYETPGALRELAGVSRELFERYEAALSSDLDKILHLRKPEPHKENENILALYRELQEQQLAALRAEDPKFLQLMETVSAVAGVSLWKHPLKKLKAYRAMLKTFHLLQREL